jgi:hypothetical protein
MNPVEDLGLRSSEVMPGVVLSLRTFLEVVSGGTLLAPSNARACLAWSLLVKLHMW